MSNERRLVLFDFDGTLTTHDTLFHFTRFAVGDRRFFAGLAFLAAPMTLQKLKLLSAQKTKEFFITHFFGGMRIDEFNAKCEMFCKDVLPKLIRPGAKETIAEYRKRNDSVFIVSASPENWIKPWATTQGIEVISTKLEIVNNVVTGKISGLNCNGDEKCNRIRKELKLEDFARVIAYGDTSGDKQMLALAHESHYKPFRAR